MFLNIPHIQSHPLELSFLKVEVTNFSFLDWFVPTKRITAIGIRSPMNADIVRSHRDILMQ